MVSIFEKFQEKNTKKSEILSEKEEISSFAKNRKSARKIKENYPKTYQIFIVLLTISGISSIAGTIIILWEKSYQNDSLFDRQIKRNLSINREKAPIDIATIEQSESLSMKERLQQESIESLLKEVLSLKRSLSNLIENYQNLEDRLEKAELAIINPARNPNIQRIISLLVLKNAIDQGENFVLGKQIGKEIPLEDPCTSTLIKFSNTKIPTSLEILTKFSKISEEMISEIEAPEQDLGFLDSLLFQLQRLIKVRFTGNVKGNTPAALIARIENNIRNGNLREAITEWDKLPIKAKNSGESLKDAIEARICSERIIGEEITKILQNNNVQE
ncbi:COG4223 family protein [Candidatus Liberibacter sp.]|uniref:COG4223 family protein n=1 Tax=Candidatus Liberibacter sp. TaxID=34022 RepID=UPI0015F63C1E|nr:hypothetical protein [Candidatus Liberibacter sp.]MBA5724157.1 hypothetical protein [Candidatus Liberibacter sp.]